MRSEVPDIPSMDIVDTKFHIKCLLINYYYFPIIFSMLIS